MYLILIMIVLFSITFYKDLEIAFKLYPNYQHNNKSTEIHFIDVGQGDSIAVKFPNGKVMLVDSGTEQYYEKLTTYIDKILNVNKIDFLVLTHIDSDHSSNILKLLDRYDVGIFYRPNIYESCENKSLI